MTGRIYTVSFSQVTIATAQDILAVYAGTMPFTVLEVWLSQTTETVTSGLPIALKYLPSVVTLGSGGSALTPQRNVPGDALATVTAASNNTTVATSTNSAIIWRYDAWQVLDPYLWNPPSQDASPVVPTNGAFILSLLTSPSGSQSIVVSGGAIIKELM